MTHGISSEPRLLSVLRDILATNPNRSSWPGLVDSLAVDDCALMPMGDGRSVAIASDFVRGSGFHLFRLGFMDYYDVGYYLIGANLSDLASVGATPWGLTTILRYSKVMNDETFRQAMEGMNDACKASDTLILGGDIGGYESDVFAATALGVVSTQKALLRSKVQHPSVLFVTGSIGNAISALSYFKEIRPEKRIFSDSEEDELLQSWKRVRPRLSHGLELSMNFNDVACQDVSDGLRATIDQLCEVSGVGFTVSADKIPVSGLVRKLAHHVGKDPLEIAMSASVDFELCFTVPETSALQCQEHLAAKGLAVYPIGVTNDQGTNILVDAAGKPSSLPGVTWKQQDGDFVKGIVR